MEAWTIAGVGFGSAVLGALVGALTTLILEVWRRVLDGIAAAHLIRMELLRIRTTIQAFLDGQGASLKVADSSWQSNAVAVAPLLDELELSDLYRVFAFLPEMDRFAKLLKEGTPDNKKRANDELIHWHGELANVGKNLRQLEVRGRLGHMWKVFFGRHLASKQELQAHASIPKAKNEET